MKQGTVAEIRNHRGAPALFVNGRPCSAMTYMTYQPSLSHFGDFGKAGVPLASFSTTPDHSYYGLVPTTWVAPGTFDYSDFDRRVECILSQHPDAWLLPRLHCCAPPWWCKAHPEEMSRGHRVGGQERQFGPHPSFASAAWRKAAAAALRRFVRRAESQPYADRIIGYHLAGGSTEEWYYIDYWDDVDRDFSEPQRRAFAHWLRRRYGSAARLRSAWDDPKASFARVTVPSRGERKSPSWGELFDVRGRDRRVADYFAFHSDVIVDVIAHLARVAKQACRRRKIVGAFYGYLFELSGGGPGPAAAGHLSMRRLLKNPDVDFFTAPTSYCFRRPADGAAAFMAPTAALRHHGKLWFDENDLRTHRAAPDSGFGRVANLRDTLAIQLRELAVVCTEATGMWWFDMLGGWYDQPAVMKAVKRMNRIAEGALRLDRRSAAEIALVVDEASMQHLRPESPLMLPLLAEQRLQIHRLGAPVDAVYLDDLADLPPYKLYVFPNAFRMTAKQRRQIDAVVKRRGRVAVWIGLPGLLGASASGRNVRRVTGIEIDAARTYMPMEVVTLPDTALTRAGCPAGLRYGMRGAILPAGACRDAEIEILGSCDHIGAVGLALKRFRNWTSIWSSAPCLPSPLLRALAVLAGVHVYADGDDALYANRRLLGIHARTGGAKTIRLPRLSAVTDVYNAHPVSRRRTKAFTVRMRKGETRLFFLGSEREWKGCSS